jgi:hypothetical protein
LTVRKPQFIFAARVRRFQMNNQNVNIRIALLGILITFSAMGEEIRYKEEAIWQRLNRDHGAVLDPIWNNQLTDPYSVIRAPTSPDTINKIRAAIVSHGEKGALSELNIIYSQTDREDLVVFLGVHLRDQSGKVRVVLYEFDMPPIDFIKAVIKANHQGTDKLSPPSDKNPLDVEGK